MAKVPSKPRPGKGTPPPLASTPNNLERPEPTGQAPLNFKVPNEFKREFKTYAAQRGISMSALLIEAFELVKERQA